MKSTKQFAAITLNHRVDIKKKSQKRPICKPSCSALHTHNSNADIRPVCQFLTNVCPWERIECLEEE